MSLTSHLLVLALLGIDLFFGGHLAEEIGGRWAMIGFEFLLILGYVAFVLQFGSFFGSRSDSGGSNQDPR
jgi:hypothetical protein